VFVLVLTMQKANLGDTEALLGRTGKVEWEATILTELHKPTIDKEARLIERRIGNVAFAKVFATISVTRSLGDHTHKIGRAFDAAPLVSAEAHVMNRKLSSKDLFVVMASDGLWDVMDYTEVIAFVGKYMAKNRTAHQIASRLCDEAISRRSQDNVSVIVIILGE
jgi:protein phosphatase